jgi:hypothetical protein
VERVLAEADAVVLEAERLGGVVTADRSVALADAGRLLDAGNSSNGSCGPASSGRADRSRSATATRLDLAHLGVDTGMALGHLDDLLHLGRVRPYVRTS